MRKLSLALVVAISLSVFVFAGVSAHHYIFYTSDGSLQVSGGLPENLANWRWTFATSDVQWKADSGIHDEVVDAIAAWESEFPGLSWNENTSTPEVTFVDASSCGGAPARWTMSNWTSDEGANYWSEGTVCVDTTSDWANSDEMVAGIAHEIGHALGLHERYVDQSGGGHTLFDCNPDGEVTIMDGPDPNESSIVHCDSPITGPASIDEISVGGFVYGGGQLIEWDPDVTGSSYTISWDDWARAEYKHQMKFFYLDGSNWVEYDARNHTDAIGSMLELPVTWSHSEFVDTTVGGYNIPPGTNTHIVCGDPWYKHDNSAGEWECSSSFQVTTPP